MNLPDHPDPGYITTRPELLIAGLYAPGSGLTNVISVIMKELGDRYSVRGLGFQPRRDPGIADLTISGCPMRVQPSSNIFMADPDWLRLQLETREPNAALVIGPAILATPLLRQMQEYRENTRLLLYLPVEGELVNEEICRTLDLVDACILYTEHARDNAADLSSRASNNGFRTPRFYVAGHGVDTSEFFPLHGNPDGGITGEKHKAAKRLLFPDRPELHDSFMVLNANRAYQRKRLDLTIAGFAHFARSRPDSYLYLHTGRMSHGQSTQLRNLIDESGVAKQILLNTLNPDLTSLPIEKLNLLYNACDVGLTTAMGEGWGLVSFEHAATGAAQIIPDHTSFRENWTGAAEMLPVAGREHIFYEFADMFTVLPRDVAGALERLYGDIEHRRRMAGAAYQRALEPRFKWPAVGREFYDIVEGTMSIARAK